MSIINAHIKKATQKITDVKDPNLFGIHLTTQKSLEAFQEKSGMKGAYTTEYQHHYWAAVGRLQVENQVLDVAIPLVLFNYPQRCTSGSVAFDLREVAAVSAQLAELADAKMKEFMSVCGTKITKALGLNWMYADQMTLHVHPGQLSTFSGTDYCKTIDDPGVVYPLNEGTDVPSFSSIMCHVAGKGKLMRTEYRMFNGTENGDKNYRHGKCISYVRREKKLNGPIEAMFIGNETVEKSYVFKDGFKGDQGDQLLEILTTIFDESGFEPSTDFILEKNVTKNTYGSRSNNTVNTFWGQTNKVPGKQKSLLLEEEEDEKKDTDAKTIARNGDEHNVGDYTPREINLMRDFIVYEGDFRFQQAKVMEDEEILFFYVETVNEMPTAERENAPVEIVANIQEPTEEELNDIQDNPEMHGIVESPTFVERVLSLDGKDLREYENHEQKTLRQYNFLIQADFSEEEILKLTDQEVEYVLETLGFDED